MDSPEARLRAARIDAGYATGTAAARAMGVKPPTYLGHENGTTGLRRGAAIRYAKFFGVSIDWLLTGAGISRRKNQVPVVGYVGAGAEVYPVDDHPKGQGLELVDAPYGLPNCVAARVRGDSMHPIRDGWLVFWEKTEEGVPLECLGQLCIVHIKDGPTLCKEVRKGALPSTYRLESWNAPPREDVELEWASRIIDIRPSL